MPFVIPDEASKSPLHVGIEGITSEGKSEEISSTSFSVAQETFPKVTAVVVLAMTVTSCQLSSRRGQQGPVSLEYPRGPWKSLHA